MTSLDQIKQEIKTEIRIADDGIGYASIRGTARVCGIDESAIRRAILNAENSTHKMTQMLIVQGFEVRTFAESGVPDLAVALIAKYYAYHAGARCTELAKLADLAFSGIGVRAWMQDLLGWTKKQEKPSTAYELIAMLAQQGIEQEKRISNLELKIDSFEARTKEATESLKGIEEPSEPAPELSTRAKINRLVREYSIGNGMEFKFVWRMLYREFRDRHGIDLHIRAKNQKTTALDLAESMGLMESLYAVGYSLLTA